MPSPAIKADFLRGKTCLTQVLKSTSYLCCIFICWVCLLIQVAKKLVSTENEILKKVKDSEKIEHKRRRNEVVAFAKAALRGANARTLNFLLTKDV